MSRTEKAFRNIIYNILSVFITTVLLFAVRTVFIRTLGIEFLGLQGLFSNILSVLSLAELGMGTAMVYSLYKPLAENDKHRIELLMRFFKKAYRVISIVIILISLILLPFIDRLISEDTSFINIQLIFIIYVTQTVSTYLFFAYKSSLLKADQKEYIIARINVGAQLISSIVQVLVLVLLQSFIFYLLVLIGTNIIINLIIAWDVKKRYEYSIDVNKDKLDKIELRAFFKDLLALFYYKVNFVVVRATDNIVLSYFIGLAIVGLYSNYLLISVALRKFYTPIFSSLKASLGNLIAQKGSENSYKVFGMINMVAVFIYGGSAVALYILSNRFIAIWIGEQFIIRGLFVALFSIQFYLMGLQTFLSSFRNSMGLFQKAKYRPIGGMLLNIILSVILVQNHGISGVLGATIISSVLTYMWFDPLIIHTYGFRRSVYKYYWTNIYHFVSLSLFAIILNNLILSNVSTTGIVGFFLITVISGLLIFIFLALQLLMFKDGRLLVKHIHKFIQTKIKTHIK